MFLLSLVWFGSIVTENILIIFVYQNKPNLQNAKDMFNDTATALIVMLFW
jgi:hypothetical protein